MPRRSAFQREKDLFDLASRYLRGEAQAIIAHDMNVSQMQISDDLRTLQARWRKSTTLLLDKHKATELAKIDLLECTYWDAWQRSLLPAETTTTKRITGDKPHDEAALRKQGKEGNATFLAGVQWCIERRCKLLGLDAGDQSDRDLNAAIERELASLAQRRQAADAQAAARDEPPAATDSSADAIP